MEAAVSTSKKASLQLIYASITLLAVPLIASYCIKLRQNNPKIKALGKVILPYIEAACEWYNEKIEELDEKGYEFFGYLPEMPITEMKLAYNLLKTAADTAEAVADTIDAVDDTVSSVPIVGDLASSVTDAAATVVDSTTSLLTENALSEAITAAVTDATSDTTKAAVQTIYTSINLLILPMIAQCCYNLKQYAVIKVSGKLILPFIEKLCDLYNEKIEELDENGNDFFGYLPEMPIDDMKTAYTAVKALYESDDE